VSADAVSVSCSGSVVWVGSRVDVSTRVETTVKVVVEVGSSSGFERGRVDVCTSIDGGTMSVESVCIVNVFSVVVDVESSTEELLVVEVG
jgi:hypothetical protein